MMNLYAGIGSDYNSLWLGLNKRIYNTNVHSIHRSSEKKNYNNNAISQFHQHSPPPTLLECQPELLMLDY